MTQQSSESEKYHCWIVTGIVILGAALRLIHLGARSFRTDEGIIAQLAKLDGPGVLRASLQNSTPALFNVQLHYLYKILGDSQFALSLLPLLYGVLTIYLLYHFASRYFSPLVGMISALLLAVAPYGVFISQELRPYSLMTFMTLASAYAFLRFLETKSWKYWILALLATSAATYSHVFAWTILIVENLFFFIHFRRFKSLLYPWLGLQFVVFLLFAPTFSATMTVLADCGVSSETVIPTQMSQGAFLYMAIKKGFGFVLHLTGGYYFKELAPRSLLGILRSPFQGAILLIMIIVPWIILLAGLRQLLKRKVYTDLLLFLLLLIPGSVFLIEGTNPNYYANASPAFFAISALGLLALSRAWRIGTSLAYGIMVAVSLNFIWASPTNTFLTEDYQGLANYLKSHRQSQEVVFFWGGKNASHAWNYYDRGPTIYKFPGWTPDNFEIARVDKPRPPQYLNLDVFPTVVDSLLEATGRVWFVMQCTDVEEIEQLLPPLRQRYDLTLRSNQPYINLMEIRKRDSS